MYVRECGNTNQLSIILHSGLRHDCFAIFYAERIQELKGKTFPVYY